MILYTCAVKERGSGKRDELIEISGQPDAPVLLLLPDGTAIAGSSNIAEWARAR